MLVVDTGVLLAAAGFYRSLAAGDLVVEAMRPEDWRRIAELVHRYADLPLGGTDASLVALAERHAIHRVATLDRRHFSVVRPSDGAAFELLPG